MRAHLLQPTYNADERDDTQLDSAANDAQFATDHRGARQAESPVVPVTTQIASTGSASDNDDYWLGGYAGI